MDLSTINSYIQNRVEESLNLDYKAADSLQRVDKKTNEISKDVSAFANSDGGLIIYGIKEDPIQRHLPQIIDPLDRKQISKEWLEQIIQSKISPRINNVIIHSITVDERADTVVYVVEIPKSDTAHQAADKKYYKRFNFNSEPMYDYEIRDILNRAKNPILNLEFEVIKKVVANKKAFLSLPSFVNNGLITNPEPEIEYKTFYTLNIWAKNAGKVLANYVNAYLDIPAKYLKDEKDAHGISNLFMENTIRDVVDTSGSGMTYIKKYGPSRYDPILPTRTFHLKDITVNDDFITSKDKLSWVVYCDNAEPQTGTISISDIEVQEL